MCVCLCVRASEWESERRRKRERVTQKLRHTLGFLIFCAYGSNLLWEDFYGIFSRTLTTTTNFLKVCLYPVSEAQKMSAMKIKARACEGSSSHSSPPKINVTRWGKISPFRLFFQFGKKCWSLFNVWQNLGQLMGYFLCFGKISYLLAKWLYNLVTLPLDSSVKPISYSPIWAS